MVPLVLSSCILAPERTRDPDASQKRYMLGADYYGKSMIPAAQEELRLALDLDPKNQEAHYLSGLIAMRQAVETQDLTMRATCLPAAEAKVQLEDVDAKMRRAGDLFREAVKLKPDYSEAWNGLAAVDLHFRRWDDALSHAERALANAAYPTPWYALANQGVAYHEKKDDLRAGKVLRQALQQNAKFCVARWRLGQVYEASGDLDRAKQEMLPMLEGKSCPIQEAYLLLGRTLVKLQEATRAEEVFAECRLMAPQSCLAKECRLAN